MCGRYTLANQLSLFGDDIKIPNISPRYNIAPSQEVAVVANSPVPDRKVEFYRWGLIPSWSKDAKIGNRMINARSETLSEKPSFRNAYRRRRCLILAGGYYEWQTVPGSTSKQPVYIHLKSGETFAFAGLWEEWHDIRSCSIITCEPNPLLKRIHHRMPVILPENAYEQWLSPDEQSAKTLQPLLTPYTDQEMEAYPVSTFVNRPVNDSPECIAPFM